ncbi:HD domain-containing phosphohydrolase [Curvivirga sp.]|uniref:HD domain-containing phosphohydrolase n=1 Tax=Curvivirga sp. TaxID=2856848 RepID=UPI003B5ABE25
MSQLNLVLQQSKILIVDDKTENVQLLEHMLDEEYYDNVYSTTDPTQVVSLYREHDFDIILLDIRMPEMSGFDVMDALLSEIKEDDYMPVLVLTAETDEVTRQKALEKGARDFLVKPFKHWEVMQRIRNMLETRYYFKQQRMKVDELEGIVERRTQEIRASQLSVVRILGKASEYRDNETGMHIIRMSKICEMIARELGESEQYCELILNAAPMHDVGKIGIPDSILLKPGRLDAEERVIMDTHAEIGGEILNGYDTPLMNMAHEIAVCHHEKWDGSGYPKKLSGKDIPISARIAAVADVYDALLSVRPYKKPWSLEDAVEMIKSSAGQHFDPDVVAAFIRILPEINEMRGEFPDD